MALENEAQLQRAEASATRRQDVEGLGTGLSYFGETLAESSVPMGVGIGTGALTGALVGGGIPGALIGAGAAHYHNYLYFMVGTVNDRKKQ